MLISNNYIDSMITQLFQLSRTDSYQAYLGIEEYEIREGLFGVIDSYREFVFIRIYQLREI